MGTAKNEYLCHFLGYKGREIRLLCFVAPAPHRASLCYQHEASCERANECGDPWRKSSAFFFLFLKAPVNVRTFPLDADRHGVTPDSVLFPPPPVDCLASDSVHTEVSGLLRNVKMIPRWSAITQGETKGIKFPRSSCWSMAPLPELLFGRLGRKWWSPHLGPLLMVSGGVYKGVLYLHYT